MKFLSPLASLEPEGTTFLNLSLYFLIIMQNLVILVCSIFVLNFAYSQEIQNLIYQQAQSKSGQTLPQKTQKELDAMQSVPEGYIAHNMTTGCINYFFQGKWYQICGECFPHTQIPKIDSLKQFQNKLWLYFNPSKSCDSLTVQINKRIYSSPTSPLAITLKTEQDSTPITLIAHNVCGQKDTTFKILIKPINISPIEIVKIDGQEYKVRKYGSCKWMLQDYIPSVSPLKDRKEMVSLVQNKNPCPKGWKIPSETQWNKLFQYFQGNMEEIFTKPSDENIGLGLQKNTIYIVSEKKFLQTNAASYYVEGQKQGKQKLVNITNIGAMFPEEDPKLFYLPLRCVLCE